MKTLRVPIELFVTVCFYYILLVVALLLQRIPQAQPIVPALKCAAPESRDQDDMCVWVHPKDRSLSTIITSDTCANMLFVYDLDGTVLQSIPAMRPGNIDLRYSFLLGGRLMDIVACAMRQDSTICVYQIDASSRRLERVDNGTIRTGGKSTGGTLYRSPRTGRCYFVATTAKPDMQVEQFELVDDGTGKVAGKKVRSWRIGPSEAAVADDETGNLYIAEDRRGVWEVGGEPTQPTPGRLIIQRGQNGLVGDIRGLALYDLPDGDDYLIVSSKGADDIRIYRRSAAHRFVGTFRVQGARHIGRVDVCTAGLGPRFPQGIFVCDAGNPLRIPILVTPWEEIATNMPHQLTIYTEWNRRHWVAQLSPGSSSVRQ